MTSTGKRIVMFFCFLLWLATLAYGAWYLKTGWDHPNAIMKYCASFNQDGLGWFKEVCVAGVLQFTAGYVAVFPFAAPILYAVTAIWKRSLWRGLLKTLALFFVILFWLALLVCCLYSTMYFMETYPLIAGLLVLAGLLGIATSGMSVYMVIIVWY